MTTAKDLLAFIKRANSSEHQAKSAAEVESIQRHTAADYLETIAKAVRDGHVLAFRVSWDGKSRLDSAIMPRQPADFILIDEVIDLKLEV